MHGYRLPSHLTPGRQLWSSERDEFLDIHTKTTLSMVGGKMDNSLMTQQIRSSLICTAGTRMSAVSLLTGHMPIHLTRRIKPEIKYHQNHCSHRISIPNRSSTPNMYVRHHWCTGFKFRRAPRVSSFHIQLLHLNFGHCPASEQPEVTSPVFWLPRAVLLQVIGYRS